MNHKKRVSLCFCQIVTKSAQNFHSFILYCITYQWIVYLSRDFFSYVNHEKLVQRPMKLLVSNYFRKIMQKPIARLITKLWITQIQLLLYEEVTRST
jgi:hypothetical protein